MLSHSLQIQPPLSTMYSVSVMCQALCQVLEIKCDSDTFPALTELTPWVGERFTNK